MRLPRRDSVSGTSNLLTVHFGRRRTSARMCRRGRLQIYCRRRFPTAISFCSDPLRARSPPGTLSLSFSLRRRVFFLREILQFLKSLLRKWNSKPKTAPFLSLF